MLTTIRGYYEEGKVILEEDPPVTEKTEVFVTFLPVQENGRKDKIRLGSLAGRIIVPENFDEPLDDLKDYM